MKFIEYYIGNVDLGVEIGFSKNKTLAKGLGSCKITILTTLLVKFTCTSCLQHGFIYIKPFPQLCLAVSDIRVETGLTDKETNVSGYVVTLQKKMVGNPHQMWSFNSDATIASKVYMLVSIISTRFSFRYKDSSDMLLNTLHVTDMWYITMSGLADVSTYYSVVNMDFMVPATKL